MVVTETYFTVEVSDMLRATSFYVDALGASVAFASPGWTSLVIARVRIGLFLNARHAGGNLGIHFAVADLEGACAGVERAGGRILKSSADVAPGVRVTGVADTEGNAFTLRPA